MSRRRPCVDAMTDPALTAIRRLPENKACANCSSESQFGHSNVVVKFRSFVCDNCKSAHQAFSHRVKVCHAAFSLHCWAQLCSCARLVKREPWWPLCRA